MKKYLYPSVIFVVFIALIVLNYPFHVVVENQANQTEVPTLGATVLFPSGGGTGKGTATAGDVGKYLKVLDDSPFTYTFDTPAGGAGGSSAFEIATTSGLTASELAYFTKAGGMTTLGGVATTTLTATSPLSFTQPVVKVGGANSVLSLDTSGTWTGNAGTASALAANAANCTAGSGAGGVSATGAAEDCTDYEEGLTAGDALTRTGNDFDFDGGATPAGDLGGTWASPSVTDNSHAHDSTTISGIDISADTNLTAGDALTLTDDDIDFDGGTAPGGELGGTWASPTVDDSLAVTSWNLTTPTFTTSFTFDAETFDSLTDDATLDNNSGDLRVVDVTCTDCLGLTEIDTTGTWTGPAGSVTNALTNDATLNGSSFNGSAAISDWGLNLANPNTWTVLQTFNYSSSTIYSSFLTASTTNLFVGTGQGFLAAGSGQRVYAVASSSISLSHLTNDLAALTAGDTSLTFSGSYNGSTARTAVLNVGRTNTWTVLQNFNYSSSTIYSSFNIASTTQLHIGSGQGFGYVGSDGRFNVISTSTLASNLTALCSTITGSADLCDGNDGGGAGGSSVGPVNTLQAADGAGAFIATGTPQLTVGNLLATSTIRDSIFLNNGFLVGTTTDGISLATFASSTRPQISLSAGAGVGQWTMRNAGGVFYLSTTTVAGTATTSISALEIHDSGTILLGGRQSAVTLDGDRLVVNGRTNLDPMLSGCPFIGIDGDSNSDLLLGQMCDWIAFDINTDGRTRQTTAAFGATEAGMPMFTRLAAGVTTGIAADEYATMKSARGLSATTTLVTEAYLRIPDAGTSAITRTWLFGLGDPGQGSLASSAVHINPSNQCAFMASSTANWRAVARRNAVATAYIDTGIATSTNTTTFRRFRIVQDYTNGCLFYVDGTLVATVAAASAPTMPMRVTIGVYGIGTTASTDISDFDFAEWQTWWGRWQPK